VDTPLIPPPALAHDESPEQEPTPTGTAAWSPWLAPAALVGGIVFAAVGGLIVDIPAALLGADVNASHLPPGLSIADTAVQDAAFVLVAIFLAQLGGRTVSAVLFGLRPTALKRAVQLVLVTVVVFLVFSLIWGAVFDVKEEKLLETLGANESTLLLVLSATLTCVIAPIGEEFLFRGFIFTALRNWRGVWTAAAITGALFGLVHVGSAPALDLVPLAVLGFALCLLYRATGSLYPCIAAHALNNSLAFGSLENWTWWQIPLLMIASLLVLASLALALTRLGVSSRERAHAM
jgi:uncharacterized protein